MSIKSILKEVEAEVLQSMKDHQERFVSLHEAYGILWEEVEEFWEVVRLSTRGDQSERNAKARAELVQVAAMAVKAATSIDAWRFEEKP